MPLYYAPVVDPEIMGHRLTLTSGTPVTTADVTAATTIYLTPFTSSNISLYDGTRWVQRDSAQVSLALGTLTSALNYDVYASWNGTAVALSIDGWTNDSTRAVAITTQNGVQVRTGDPLRRYMGTFRTTSTTTTENSLLKRLVWNKYNQVRTTGFFNAAGSWSYVNPNGLWRQVNLNTACQVQVVFGDTTALDVKASLGCTVPTASAFSPGIGFNSINVNSAQTFGQWGMANGYVQKSEADYSGLALPGYYAINMLESGQVASGTYTFQGAGNVWGSGITAVFQG